MTFKRIDESTIRCIVTEEDMEENGLELDDFFKQSDKAQDFLRELIEQATEEVGYESSPGMVSLQIMPLPDHALAITFSESESKEWHNMMENIRDILEDMKERVKEQGTLQDGDAPELTAEEVPAVDIPAGKGRRGQGVDAKMRLFAFVSLRHAIQYAKTVQEKGAVHSTLYKDAPNQVFYMTLEKGRLSSNKYNVLCTNATEFATYIADGDKVLGYLKEHGEVLIEKRAVKVLAKL